MRDADLAILERLRSDRPLAEAERDAAERGGSGLKAAFWEAHRWLAELPPQPETSKAERLAAYDARMRAGHAWHPWKTRLREAERWLKPSIANWNNLRNPERRRNFMVIRTSEQADPFRISMIPVDQAFFESEQRWGVGRLERLVSPSTLAAWQRGWSAYRVALDECDGRRLRGSAPK